MTPRHTVWLLAALALLVVSTALTPAAAAGSTVGDSEPLLESGTTVWRGQTVYFDGSAVVEHVTGDDPAAVPLSGRTFSLHAVTDDGSIGKRVRTVSLNERGESSVRTTALAGQYVLVYDGRAVEVDDGRGVLRGPVSEVNVSEYGWTITDNTSEVSVALEAQRENGTLVFPTDTDTRLSGTVDLPEGTEVVLTFRNDGDRPFLFWLETDLGPDGRFSETVDLSDVETGTPVNVSVSLGDQRLTTERGIIGVDASLGTTPATTTTTIPVTSTRSPTTTTTVPGFGPLVGVAGVLFVAGAAGRRAR